MNNHLMITQDPGATPASTMPRSCPEKHSWCWGACALPNQDHVEHRTWCRHWEPAEQFGETRQAHQVAVSTRLAMRPGGEPLVHLSIQTDRRSLEVGLSFWELNQLVGDLWYFAGILAAESR